MITKTLSALAVAAGLLFASAPAQAVASPAGIATQKVDFKQVGFKKAHHRRKFRRNRHRHRHWHFNLGHSWYGYRGCGYFYRKARWTGARYWWKRYRRCISHQHYRY